MIDRTEMAEMDIRDEPFRLDWVTALLPAERKAEAASWSNTDRGDHPIERSHVHGTETTAAECGASLGRNSA